MSYIDLHLHLLPATDDGPADLAESLAHARRLVAADVLEATVTPHVGHPDFPLELATIPERTTALQQALRRAHIPLRLHPGGEIHPAATAQLSPAELDVVAQGPSGARWVLLEVPWTGIDERFLAGCAHVRAHGFGIVVAHPERAERFVAEGLGVLRAELLRGAVLQVSVCSLLGRHGEAAREAAVHLVRGGMAYLLASDGHGGERRHTLAEGRHLARGAGASAVRAWQLTEANPRFLLTSGIPPAADAETAAAYRSTRERSLTSAIGAARRWRR